MASRALYRDLLAHRRRAARARTPLSEVLSDGTISGASSWIALAPLPTGFVLTRWISLAVDRGGHAASGSGRHRRSLTAHLARGFAGRGSMSMSSRHAGARADSCRLLSAGGGRREFLAPLAGGFLCAHALLRRAYRRDRTRRAAGDPAGSDGSGAQHRAHIPALLSSCCCRRRCARRCRRGSISATRW